MDASLSSGVLEVAVSPDQPNFLECSLDPVHNHDETDVKNKKKISSMRIAPGSQPSISMQAQL